MNELIAKLKNIAEKNGIKVTFNCDMVDANNGGASGSEIWLGKFEDADLLAVLFFHELAHCFCAKVLPLTKYRSSLLAQEGFCWEYGFELAAENGFKWDITHKVYKYAEKNLRSYV